MEICNAIGEELKKDASLTPATPGKPSPPRTELNSVNRGIPSSKFLFTSNLNSKLHVGFDDSSTLSYIHANKEELHEELDLLGRIDLNQSVVSDMEFGVSGGEFHGESCNDGLIRSFDSIGYGNLNSGDVSLTELMASHDDSSLPVCGASTSEGVQDSSAGLGLIQDISKDEPPKIGLVDSKFFDGNSECGFGLRSSTPSTPAVKSSSKKRSNNGVDMNKKPRKRLKMKRHRPKIYDESKPRKTPKSQTAKSSVPSQKRKYVRRSNLKAEGQEVIRITKLKTKEYVRRRGPLILNPLTPERSIPKQAILAESPCKRKEDTPEFLVNLLDNDEGQEIKENSELGVKSCRRALNFSVEDQMQSKSEERSPFKWGFNLQQQDFDTCPELNRIVNHYRRGKRSLRKSRRKSSVKLNLISADLNSYTEMKNKSNVDSCQLSNEVDWQDHSLKVYRRTFRPNECVKNSRKLGPNFPKLCKKKMSKRTKIENCSRLWNDLTSNENLIELSKGSLRKSTVSEVDSRNSLMKRILRPRKPTLGAMSYMKASKCIQPFRPKARARRKRLISSALKRNLAVKLSKSRGVQGKGSTIIDLEICKTAPPFSCAVTKKKRSKSSIRRRTFQLPLTFVPQAFNVGSQGINDRKYEACGYFCDVNNQNMLRNGVSHEDRLLSYHKTVETDPPVCNDRVLNCMQDHLHQEDVPFNSDIKACSSKCSDVLQFSSTQDTSTKALIEFNNQESAPLPNNKCTQLVVQGQNSGGAILPYEGKIDPSKKKKPQSKVDIDPETMRMWKLLMENDGSKVTEEVDEEKEKWWEEQRDIFYQRVESLLAIMHLIQGNRRFSPWKGSVVDSVVGAFLTQNVSDHLSSSAFMSLRARYPPKVTSNHGDNDKDSTCTDESNKSSARVDTHVIDTKDEHSCVHQSDQNVDLQCLETMEDSINDEEASGLVEDEIGDNASERHESACSSDSNVAAHAFRLLGTPDAFRQILESEEHNFLQKFYDYQKEELPLVSEENFLASSSEKVTFPNDHLDSGIKIFQSEKKSRRRAKTEEKPQPVIDWDELRRTYSSSRSRDATSNARDAIDWEAVRQASLEEVAATIAMRGQHRVIGARIKELLDRLVKDHGSIDLEWLRDVPPDKAKDYLLSIKGLGLKSVECIRLLALHHMAFPVDVNVGRVAVRLGWVPLQPLPEDLQIHLLNQYPMMDSIQMYLWPRLCTLDQRTLYELHYQLITFGKVFCTKKQPNCNACPMRGECRHFASAFASARLRLPGPQQKGIVTSTTPIAADQEPILPIPPAILSLLDTNSPESGYRTLDCEPTVEFPKSPEPEPTELPVRDIEDFYYDSEDEMPLIKLNAEVFKENLLNFVDKTEPFLQEGDVSQALVALSVEAASVPMPKLKNVNRLRTEHQVYELPDSHPLLARLDKREPDDPCPYLLAISTTGESSNSSEQLREPWMLNELDLNDSPTCSENDSSQEQNNHRVRGTIFVPCRTAEKGSFPLNGTYFQVNEVFADHESSQRQINIPRSWLWNLPTRTLYCGTSASSIFKGLSMEEIQRCFWKGFICVRGYDRKTGNPKPLSQRFHVSTTMAGMAGKKKQAENE